MEEIKGLVGIKNKWLASQVEVDFPTAESIKGRELYQKAEQSCIYKQLTTCSESSVEGLEIHKADFHRLTVIFAQLQSTQFQGDESAWVLEFFAQIILSNEHALYLGFIDQKPVFAAIVSCEGTQVLVSDIAIAPENKLLSYQDVAVQLTQLLELDTKHTDIWFCNYEK